MKKRLFLFIRILVSLSLIVLLFWMMRDKLGRIANALINANLAYLLLGFLVYVFAVVIMGLRLQKVLSVQGVGLSAKESVFLCFLGFFFNNFLPTSIGGDVVKAYYAGKKSNKKASAFSGVFMDRLFAMLPFTFLPACALLFAHDKISNPHIIYVIIFLFIATSVILFILLNEKTAKKFRFILRPVRGKRVYDKITGVYASLNVYKHHAGVLLVTFLFSIISQSLFIISVFIWGLSLGVNYVGLGVYFIMVPIIGVVSMIPSINGLGIREAGAVYLLKSYMGADTAFALSMIILASLIGLSLIGGAIYMFKKEIYDFDQKKQGEMA